MTREQAKKLSRELIGKMTVEEKLSQLYYISPAIPRLNINAHNWWNEALHGVARCGTATVFPQAIGMAASFDDELLETVGDIIATEGRAKYNESSKQGDYGIYRNLTYWSPNINIFRDPRWGRGQETYGEDPFLTAKMGVAFVRGLQGDGEFMKAAGCAKHFAVHSGPEATRHSFDARASKKDMYETYLPAFEKLADEKVAGFMFAYNRTNGDVCCANPELSNTLRNVWNFEGYTVSDYGAISDFHNHHKVTANPTESAAKALNGGCNLHSGEEGAFIFDAYKNGDITEDTVDDALVNLFSTRFLLGEFEENRPFSDIPITKVECKEHLDINLKMAKKSMVLLKNEDNFLPLDKNTTKNIAVIGPNAISQEVLIGNYSGNSGNNFNILQGIKDEFANANVMYEKGSVVAAGLKFEPWSESDALLTSAIGISQNCDITIACIGLDPKLEGEEGDDSSGDRNDLYLPKCQQILLDKLCDTTENLVVVLFGGSCIDLGEKVRAKAKAIVCAFYPGTLGGKAVAKLLSGEFSPSGRLPVTFYSGTNTLPDMDEYSMENRTYRYMNEKPVYPFGFGLSYTDFEYDNLCVEKADNGYTVTVDVKNIGKVDSCEVAQVYAKYTASGIKTPNLQLCGFKNVFIKAGETKAVKIDIDGYWLCAVDDEGKRVKCDDITFFVGGHQPDERSSELCNRLCLEKKI